MPTKEFYEDAQRQAFVDLQWLLAEDWAAVERDGFNVDGVRAYPVVLGMKGDWSFLAAWLFGKGPLLHTQPRLL